MRINVLQTAWATNEHVPHWWRKFPEKYLVKDVGIPREDLIEFGVLNGAPSARAWVNSMSAIATVLAEYFKAQVTKMYIHRWKKGMGIPPGTPTFPMPDPKTSQYNVAECLAWYKEHIHGRKTNGHGDTGLLSKLVEERDKSELERLVHARFERDKEFGKYVLETDALDATVGALQKLRAFFRRAAERQFGKAVTDRLRESFTAEQLAVIGEACLAVGKDVVREVEEECEKV